MDPEMPLKEILDRFEGYLAAAGKSANTLRAYTRDLKLFGESGSSRVRFGEPHVVY
jgi:hypothetical protein